MSYFTRPEEVIVGLRDLLRDNAGPLGLQHVYLGEEDLIPEYPCCQIVGQPVQRNIHATNAFQVFFYAAIWIYHSDLMVSHQQRTIDDMILATNVVKFLHLPANRHMNTGDGDRLIFAFVQEELPGRLRRPNSASIISTRLWWEGESRVLYQDS